jgi:hypothetical protein
MKFDARWREERIVFGKTIITNFSFCGASAHIFVTKRFR